MEKKVTARIARLSAKMSQKVAGEAAGLSERTIWAIENGKVPFSEKHRKLLAKVYDIEPEDFMIEERPCVEYYACK